MNPESVENHYSAVLPHTAMTNPSNVRRILVGSAGKILLQSEGFEIWFRKFELHPLKASSE